MQKIFQVNRIYYPRGAVYCRIQVVLVTFAVMVTVEGEFCAKLTSKTLLFYNTMMERSAILVTVKV